MKYSLINNKFVDHYAENLLMSRGVKDIDEYMNPTPATLQSPKDLKNIGMAAALYLRIVLQERPNILIVVDSDNDGFTSAAIIYQYTKQVNCHAQIDYLLHEGKQHGLQDHIDSLMANNKTYDLIILPDSSSNDAHYHDMLDEIHLPCLILDHHITDIALSDNAVVVNNQLSPDYHNKELTGAGVVYQFCRYLDEKLGQSWANNYIDLAAWGIIGDMGSVIEIENRYIIHEGLCNIQNDFLHCLLDKAGYSITGKMNPTWDEILAKTNPISIAFYVVPMVNAVIRVGTMEEKELLFQAFIDGAQMVPCNKRGAKGTLERADIEAARICTNAKNHQNKMKEEAVERLESKIAKYDLLSNKILFVRLDDDDKFPAELNGLVAMQLSVKYSKPTIVARLNNEGFIRGSARGLNDSDLKDFKQFLTDSHFFEYAQGHANAFGISIPNNNLHAFHDYANDALKDIDFGENSYLVNFDYEASDRNIGKVISSISDYAGIWGCGNAEPLFHISHLYFKRSDIRIMGTNKDTIKIESNGIAYMKFKAKDFIQELQEFNDDVIDLEIVGTCNMNEWMGKFTPQIFINQYEIKKSKTSILDF